MSYLPLPINLIPTRGLVSDTLATSGTITRDPSPEFIVSGGYLSASASDLPEESGVESASSFAGTLGEITQSSITVGWRGAFAYRVINPSHLSKQLRLIQKNHLLERFEGVVNAFTYRSGKEPSNGFFLLLKKDLDNIGTLSNPGTGFGNALYGIELSFKTNSTSSVVIQGLGIAGAIAITPTQTTPEYRDSEVASQDNHDNQVYLVELSDERYVAHMSTIEQSYNIRTPAHQPTGTNSDIYVRDTDKYYQITMDNGAILDGGVPGTPVPWTWERLIKTIWNQLPDSFPVHDGDFVDFTTYADYPSSGPENFNFEGGSAWDALWEVLDSIFHSAVRTHDGYWRIVSSTKLNTASDSPRNMMHTAKNHLIDSINPLADIDTKIPAEVDVIFPAKRQAPWSIMTFDGSSTPCYELVTPQDIFETGTEGSYTKTVSILEDLSGSGGTTAKINDVENLSTLTNKYYPDTRTFSSDYAIAEASLSSSKNTKIAIYQRHHALYNEFDSESGVVGGALEAINQSELDTYAEEIAVLFVNWIAHTNTQMLSTYSGYWNFEATHKLTEITWGDLGTGPFTRIIGKPKRFKEITEKISTPKNKPMPRFNRFITAYNPTVAQGGSEILPTKSGTVRLQNGTVNHGDGFVDLADVDYGSNNYATVTVHHIGHREGLNAIHAIPPGTTGIIMWDEQIRRWITTHQWWGQKNARIYSGKISSDITSSTTSVWVESQVFGNDLSPIDGGFAREEKVSAANVMQFEAASGSPAIVISYCDDLTSPYQSTGVLINVGHHNNYSVDDHTHSELHSH